MKKKGYYEYENGIYPLKLWVHIGKDLKELIDSCFDKCNAPDRDYGGVTYSDAVRKSDNRRGVLVSFQCSKDMSMDYCCHEASRLRCHRGCHWYGTRRRAFCLSDWLDCVLHQQGSFGNLGFR